jgi:AraC family transcriptional regulator
MILKDFPELQWLKKQAEERFSGKNGWGGRILPEKGWPTVILNVETNRTYRDNIRGPLSIFTNIAGESEVETGNHKVKIREGLFFITNHDQHYTLGIDHPSTQTFNIHFGEFFADRVFNTLLSQPEQLLDEPYFTAPFERLEFYNRLRQRDATFNTLVDSIRLNPNDNLLREEKLFELGSLLLTGNKEIQKMQRFIPAVKNSTREEIVSRLLRAVDYVHSYYDRELSLEEMASVACLSKFHFLRLFKIAFKKTPHQFISEVKINRAKNLLKTTTHDVVSIARTLGFDNSSTFSRMFYNQVGAYPTQFRAGS